MSAITFDKDPSKWFAEMQPLDQLNLNPLSYNTTKEKLEAVFAYIRETNWHKISPLTELRSRDTKLDHEIFYLGRGNFYIDLHRDLPDGTFKKVTFALAYNAEKKIARIDVKGCSYHIVDSLPMCDRERDIALQYSFLFGHVYAVLRTQDKQALYMQRFECELTDQITSRTLFGKSVSSYDAITIAIQLAEDLHTLHTKGFFHGDVVPWNSLVRRIFAKNKIVVQFVSHLHDFGLAFKKDEVENYLNEKLGNLPYLPPEIIIYGFINIADPNKINLNAWEVWSLGKMIQELLCPDLQIPWPDYPNNALKEKDSQKKDYDLIKLISQMHKYKEPIPHDPNKPLEALVVSMLAHDPEKRPNLETVIQKLVAFRETLALPSCIRDAIKTQPPCITKNLEPVIQCILRNSWKHVPQNTRYRRRDTSLPLGFIKLSEDQFYIHLNPPKSKSKRIGLGLIGTLQEESTGRGFQPVILSGRKKIGLIYEPNQKSAKLCRYESNPISLPQVLTEVIKSEQVIAKVSSETEKKQSVLTEFNNYI